MPREVFHCPKCNRLWACEHTDDHAVVPYCGGCRVDAVPGPPLPQAEAAGTSPILEPQEGSSHASYTVLPVPSAPHLGAARTGVGPGAVAKVLEVRAADAQLQKSRGKARKKTAQNAPGRAVKKRVRL
jgi:hypothetical protein